MSLIWPSVLLSGTIVFLADFLLVFAFCFFSQVSAAGQRVFLVLFTRATFIQPACQWIGLSSQMVCKWNETIIQHVFKIQTNPNLTSRVTRWALKAQAINDCCHLERSCYAVTPSITSRWQQISNVIPGITVSKRSSELNHESHVHESTFSLQLSVFML